MTGDFRSKMHQRRPRGDGKLCFILRFSRRNAHVRKHCLLFAITTAEPVGQTIGSGKTGFREATYEGAADCLDE